MTMSDVAVLEREETISLSLLYNAFEPSTAEKHELVWRADTSLQDYLEGLPEDTEWMVFHNGYEVSLDIASTVAVEQGDNIGLIVVPQGGNTMKAIFRIVLVAAASVAGFMIGGPPGAIIGAALASIAVTILTMPKKPKNNAEETSSYGIDGAKNSAVEGIPYPIVYGNFRVGGNFSDVYTENVGDDQYLYLRTVLSDGRVSAIEDIELNEQPISNFKDIQVRKSLGSLTEPVNDWFRNSIRQVNKSIKIDTGWITHTTTTPVDKVRFDLVFSTGLVKVNQKKGTYSSQSVTFVAEYRPLHPTTKVPTGDWTPLGIQSASNYSPSFEQYPGGFIPNLTRAVKAIVYMNANSNTASAAPAQPQYSPVGQNNWINFGNISGNTSAARGYSFDTANDGSVSGPTNITPQVTSAAEINLPPLGAYDFRVINGEMVDLVTEPQPTSNSVTVSDKRTRQIRKSMESRTLPEGFYEVRIRRTTPTSTDEYLLDEVFLTDVAEIETDRVAMRGTANLSLRIKLTDQLNNIPSVTAKVTGGPIQHYDIDGKPTVEAATANNAWVALDMMLGAERGVGYSLDRIDWPRWLEFAQYCTDNNITQNRVFDQSVNFGDAFQEVLRGAQAAPVPFGTKHSVVVDRPRAPTAAFTQANINKGTFAISYSSINDRANEFEVTYYDKNDRNKAKTLRYVDPKVVAFSEIPRPVQIQLKGCDNVEMARRELWRAVYSNRYIIRTVSFEASLCAINTGIGDVALIHHDQMEWAKSGRLQADSTASVLKLDQLVTKEAGTYAALVHFDALSVGTRIVSSVVGSKILVTGALIGSLGAQRLIVNGNDYEIVSTTDGGTYHTVQLAQTLTGVAGGNVCEFWRTDVLEQREVGSISLAADGTSIVNLTTPLPAAPIQFANFIFGRVENVIKPYALTGISGSGVDKRKLSFVEYNENVYLPPETVIPAPILQISDRIVPHVQTLLFDYDRLAAPETTSINARVHWSPAVISNYAGADIYMALNGSGFRTLGSALNVSEYHVQLAPNDIVEFKVVAYSNRGDRAVFSTAPTVKGTITPIYAKLDTPTGLTSATTAFTTDGTILISWSPPTDAQGVTGYELEWKPVEDIKWNNVGVIQGLQFNLPAIGLGTFDYRVKSVGGSSFSIWSTNTHEVLSPVMTGAVVSLKVSNSSGTEFSGRDAQFTWADAIRDQAFFLDYQVRVLTTGNVHIRTEYTSVPSYSYTYAKNVEDSSGTPRRSFKIEVRQRGRQGQLSPVSVLSVSNPAPAAPGVSVSVTDKVATLTFSPPSDPDYQSVKVWRGVSAGVAETAANLIHNGVDTNVTFTMEPSQTVYVRFASVDAFGVASTRIEQAVTASASDTLSKTDPAALAAIQNLQTTYGNTASSAQNAAAAAASAIAADVAKFASQSASAIAASKEALAEAHKNAAQTAATSATTQATIAAGQAVVSTNAASAAATSQTLTATYANNASSSNLAALKSAIETIPSDFTQDGKFFIQFGVGDTASKIEDVYPSIAYVNTPNGRVLRFGVNSTQNSYTHTNVRKLIPIVPNIGRWIRVTVRGRLNMAPASGSIVNMYQANYGLNTNAGVLTYGGYNIDTSSVLGYPSAVPMSVVGQVYTISQEILLTTPYADVNGNIPSQLFCGMYFVAADGGTVGQPEIIELKVEDVTLEMESRKRATIATTQANIATTQATSATSAASSAQSSAVLSATIGQRSLNKNPQFADWTGGSGTVPADWTQWINSSLNTREAGDVGGYAFQQVCTAGTSFGLACQPAGLQGVKAAGWYVIKAVVTLISGSLASSAVYLANDVGVDLWLSSEVETTTNTVVGAGVPGRKYTFEKIVYISGTSTNWAMFALSNWYGDLPAKTIKWHECSVRDATSAEIRDRTVLAPMQATVATNSSAIATIDGRTQAYMVNEVTAGSTSARLSLFAKDFNGNVASEIELIANSVSIKNNTNNQIVEVAKFANGKAQINGAMLRGAKVYPRSDSKIAMDILLKPLQFLASDGQVVQYQNGDSFGAIPASIEPTLTGIPNPPVGSSQDVRAINITPTSFTVRAKTLASATTASQFSEAGSNVGGTPQWQADKPTVANSSDGNYQFKFEGTVLKSSVDIDFDNGAPYSWTVYYEGLFDIYVTNSQAGNAWVSAGSIPFTLYNSGSSSTKAVASSQVNSQPTSRACSINFVINSSVNIGQHAGKEFGVHPVVGTISAFTQVSYVSTSSTSETSIPTLIPWKVYPPNSD